ncbi:MAG: hypothetical protein SOR65_00215 [Odoribacter sp.]|nr:hypothetical protein [Odoribacter sp.]
MTEELITIFSYYHSVEEKRRQLFQQMLRMDVEEKLKICHEDEQGRYVHSNLDVQRHFQPVEPTELTRSESYALQHFIGVQYHFLLYMKNLLQQKQTPVTPGFRWKGGIGQLLELLDALQLFVEPTCPQGTQKYWFESFCTLLQMKCPANLNQELQKKRNRYAPTRFLQELQTTYLNKCQHIE